MFDYGELILGGRFMVRRDDDFHKLVGEAYSLLEAVTLSESAADAIRGKKDLVDMMSQNDLLVRSPKLLIDHRKLYLLKADDGRTRVIKGSANMTGSAWSENQMESYEVDDSQEAYEAYLEDFESAWDLSSDIPEDVVASKKTDKAENDIPIIKEAMKTRQAIVFEEKKADEETYDRIRHTIEVENLLEKNKALLVGVKPLVRGGMIEIIPEKIKRIIDNNRSFNRKK